MELPQDWKDALDVERDCVSLRQVGDRPKLAFLYKNSDHKLVNAWNVGGLVETLSFMQADQMARERFAGWKAHLAANPALMAAADERSKDAFG